MNTDGDSSLSIEIALLGLVAARPAHGYEIYQRLNLTPELRLIWRFKQSRLYAMLARLEEAGYLWAAPEESPEGRPPRKVLHLTPAGREAFAAWLVRPVDQPREMRLAFMLKLYFATAEGPAAVTRLVEGQQAVCAGWLALQNRGDEAATPFIRAVRRYRRSHVEAIRDWLATLIDEPLPAGVVRP